MTLNQTATFDVLADGTALNYQWYFSNAPLAAGTNHLLTLNSVQTNDAGFYYAVVTNTAGGCHEQRRHVDRGDRLS